MKFSRDIHCNASEVFEEINKLYHPKEDIEADFIEVSCPGPDTAVPFYVFLDRKYDMEPYEEYLYTYFMKVSNGKFYNEKVWLEFDF